MLDAWRVVRFALSDFWEDLVLFLALNVLWSVSFALPFLPWLFFGSQLSLWFLPLSLLLALPLPIVSGGLCFVANQATRAKALSMATFRSGVKRYWAKSLIVALINAIVLALVASNINFYAFVLHGTWTNFVLSLWLVAGIYWLLAQIFWFPLILEQEDERPFLALRNALALVIISPGFSLVLGLIVLLLAIASLVLTVPAILLLASLLMLVANHATRSRLARVRKKPYRPGPEED